MPGTPVPETAIEEPAIDVRGLTKRFGAVTALADVDLTVPRGRVLALLGPNGAGKTTLVRVLTTLLRPDAGRARVAGCDVVADAARLRHAIGLAGQHAAVDDLLTGRENLELVGLLYGLDRAERRRRAADVLERFSLTDAGDALVRTYSGGMRRRLDVGAALVGRPPVLFLDEPTTGLDPRSRNELWRFVKDLVAGETTVLLTTQQMAEAEYLADRIAVLTEGRVIAEGTAGELKARAGGDVLQARVARPEDLARAGAVLARVGDGPVQVEPAEGLVSVPTSDGTRALVAAGRRLARRRVELADLAIRRPSLDDVFLTFTGGASSGDAGGDTVGDTGGDAGGGAGRR
jgi:ABC-2 type transport system ATP-binding protein